MPVTAARRARLGADIAVCTGWLTDLVVDRTVWIAMDARVSTQVFQATSPDAESTPIFDLDGATAGTAVFHGAQIIVLQSGSRQICFGVPEQHQLSRWLSCFQLCASAASASSTAPVSVSRSLLRSVGSHRERTPLSSRGAVFSSDIPARVASMRRLRAYGTPAVLLLIGETPPRADCAAPPPGHPSAVYRILRFDRTVPAPATLASILHEDSVTHSAAATVEIVRAVFR